MVEVAEAPPWLETCVRAALAEPALVAEFDRMHGTNLSLRGSGLDLKIDLACSRPEGDVAMFVRFVHECVALRVAPD